MLKCKKARTILVLLALTFALSGTALAKQISETAELFYNNIKLYIDGAEIVPMDANGNVVEPFTFNGTTYLPVRAISSAFGQDVEWDGATQSIYIGKKDQTKPDNYLDRIQYNDYKEGSTGSDLAIINGNITDFNNNIYTNGLLFYADTYGSVKDDSDEADVLIAYPLNSQYKKLNGKIVLPKSYNITAWGNRDAAAKPTDIWFYGDNELLYKATNVTSSMPFSLNIDVTGVNQLTIKIKPQYDSHVALTDLALYK